MVQKNNRVKSSLLKLIKRADNVEKVHQCKYIGRCSKIGWSD
jgi:hypothetical protein